MTQQEFEIVETARLIRERDEWELMCKGCKHLGNVTWEFGSRSGRTHCCEHPERQGGFSDPRPYGCKGYRYERN